MASEAERAYMAGLFDGEGCIGIYMRGAWTPQVTVSQVDTRPLLLFEKLAVPSDVNLQKSGVTNYVWYSRQGLPVIQALRPYLIVKAQEADYLLEYGKIVERYVKGQHWTVDDRLRVGELALAIKQVKLDRRKRGI